jgi:hypothetical protein
MALHTDTPNPHVHGVMKATSDECERLNIKKATLRDWREAFGRHLHSQGLAAAARSTKHKRRQSRQGCYEAQSGRRNARVGVQACRVSLLTLHQMGDAPSRHRADATMSLSGDCSV